MGEREHFTNGRVFAFGTGTSVFGIAFGAQLAAWNHWIAIGAGYGAGALLVALSSVWILRSYFRSEAAIVDGADTGPQAQEDVSDESPTDAPKRNPSDPFRFVSAAVDEQVLVVGRNFSREVVDFDGKRFVNCQFRDVRIRYNGTSNFSMDRCQIGPVTLVSENPAVETAWTVAIAFDLLHAAIQGSNGESLPHMSPPTR